VSATQPDPSPQASPSGSTARVLVVEDDARIAASVRRALTYEGYEVEVARDGPSALERARVAPPDLVVLDVMLPRLDGLEVCRRLRQASNVSILMLTARDSLADRVRGLDSGADDYLVKPFSHDELLARLRAMLRRRALHQDPDPSDPDRPGRPPTIVRAWDLSIDTSAREVRRGERLIGLTALEFDLLEHFMRHSRQVLTRAQLLESVWGFDATTASNVVDVYVGYLRTKLEDAGEPRLLHTVRGVGYVLREG
jgi:two-component system response regulator MprA